jgi:5'(3')-deoxyribonucleotidase
MKKLFDKIGNFLRNAFTDISQELESKAPLAVRITNYVKEGIEDHDGSIQWILDKTVSEKDNEAYEFIKEKLPHLIKELTILDGLAKDTDNLAITWEIYVKYIHSKMKQGRAKDWVFLAGDVLGFIINRKAPIAALISVTQKVFHLIFGKK